MLDKNTFKVIQLTDCHLFKDESLMLDVNTHKTFFEVLERVKADDLADADAIFLTGDLSQDESQGSYQKLVDALKNLNLNIYWIPGNHDNIATVSEVFSQSEKFIRTLSLNTPHWDFIFLNTKVDGTEAGYLSENELSHLQDALNKSHNKPIAIVMHHQPYPTGTPMIDNCMLKNPAPFKNLIAKHNVKVIMCGHVHGDYSIQCDGHTKLEASPATCIQWAKGATKDQFVNKIGYKIYHFEKDSYVSQAKLWDS